MNETERTPVPEHLRPTVVKATPPQIRYFNSLRVKKNLAKLSKDQRDWITTVDFAEVPKKRASDVITELEKLAWLPKEEAKEVIVREGIETTSDLYGLPPGRYALPKTGTIEADNELRFYQCWQSPDKTTKRLYLMFGPSEAKLPYKSQMAVAKLIIDSGIRECAIRYGMEIRACSNCGRRLTNRISRELGIGPICGGRMFGDDWKDEVKSKRLEIVARGEDPDEELED